MAKVIVHDENTRGVRVGRPVVLKFVPEAGGCYDRSNYSIDILKNITFSSRYPTKKYPLLLSISHSKIHTVEPLYKNTIGTKTCILI